MVIEVMMHMSHHDKVEKVWIGIDCESQMGAAEIGPSSVVVGAQMATWMRFDCNYDQAGSDAAVIAAGSINL